MIGTSDFKVEGGNSIVGGGDVGIEVCLGDIFGETLSFVFEESVIL